MSAIRFDIFLKQLEENLFNLGEGKAVQKVFGEDAEGNPAALYNFTDSAHSTGDRAFIVRFKLSEVSGIAWPEGLQTKSHSFNQNLLGNATMELFLEDPSTKVGDHPEFNEQIKHVLRGQHGAAVKIYLTDSGTVPQINGFNGAGSDVKGDLLGSFLPYGRSVAAGTIAG